MTKIKNFFLKVPKWLYYVIPAFILALVLSLAASNANGFAEWYSCNIYPVFVNTVGRLSSVVPFSVCEILLYLVIIAAAVGAVLSVIFLIRGKGRRKKLLMRILSVILCFAVSVYLAFTLLCGINYYRTPFSVVSGLDADTYTVQELADLCGYLMANTNEAAKNIETDETLTVRLGGKLDLQSECIKAMEKLGEEYNSLSGFYPNAKPVLASEGMSCIRILGMYAPFTVEANYNVNAPDFAKPFTVCHELSHLKGFMREDEANYIAFLACIGSDNEYLNYAGWIYALLYAANAFYSAAGEEAYLQLMSYADEKVIAELNANSVYWKKYETPVAEVAAAVNDTYLKTQGQTDGRRSYGRFVDLMIYRLKSVTQDP